MKFSVCCYFILRHPKKEAFVTLTADRIIVTRGARKIERVTNLPRDAYSSGLLQYSNQGHETIYLRHLLHGAPYFYHPSNYSICKTVTVSQKEKAWQSVLAKHK